MSNHVKAQAIVGFKGDYDYLSNDFLLIHPYHRPIAFGKLWFPSVTHAFEASKTRDLEARKRISLASDARVARMMAKMTLQVSDWQEQQLPLMEQLVMDKFLRNQRLMLALLRTEDKPLVHTDFYRDTFWGAVENADGVWEGENHLGKILMRVRLTYRNIQQGQ